MRGGKNHKLHAIRNRKFLRDKDFLKWKTKSRGLVYQSQKVKMSKIGRRVLVNWCNSNVLQTGVWGQSRGRREGGQGDTMTPGPMDFRGPMGFRGVHHGAVGFRGASRGGPMGL